MNGIRQIPLSKEADPGAGRSAAGGSRFGTQVVVRSGGDPPTPLVRAHRGDPIRFHVIGSPGSEQGHNLNHKPLTPTG